MADITIHFSLDGGKPVFSYKTAKGSDAKRLNVDRGEDITWNATESWGISFPSHKYPGNVEWANRSQPTITIQSVDFGRYKYWVAVRDRDNIYLDDPDLIVGP